MSKREFQVGDLVKHDKRSVCAHVTGWGDDGDLLIREEIPSIVTAYAGDGDIYDHVKLVRPVDWCPKKGDIIEYEIAANQGTKNGCAHNQAARWCFDEDLGPTGVFKEAVVASVASAFNFVAELTCGQSWCFVDGSGFGFTDGWPRPAYYSAVTSEPILPFPDVCRHHKPELIGDPILLEPQSSYGSNRDRQIDQIVRGYKRTLLSTPWCPYASTHVDVSYGISSSSRSFTNSKEYLQLQVSCPHCAEALKSHT